MSWPWRATSAAGETLVLFQPRLLVALGSWDVRGDVDILRLARDPSGALQILIADIKSSTAAKVEHRLQVAFYSEMVAALLADAGIAADRIDLGILYRGPTDDAPAATASDRDRRELERERARDLLGVEDGLLELVADAEAYRGSVRDLVTGERSTARRVIDESFAAIPFHLTYKCDGCLYNEFCMKRSAEMDDLSLLPHLTEQDKRALRRNGIATPGDLVALKDLRRGGEVSVDGVKQERTELVAAAGKSALARRLAATWPVGQRLDELIHRARSYRRWKKDDIEALTYIPSKGYGSLPYSDDAQNPNLVRVYIDAQHDYLLDRTYLLGALVVASEGGEERPERRRSVVRLSEGPPDTLAKEERLFVDWIEDTLRAIVELAAPDEQGESRAPIHLIFYDDFAQRVLLDGLARHAGKILGATPLYDFVTQLAAFDSPIATFLDREIRDQKNYPMVCQSLQAVAAFLRFDWNEGTPYRDIFRARLFDFWAKMEPAADASAEIPGMGSWYTGRARFNSQLPLEYAYAAWGDLPWPPLRGKDDLAPYRDVTPELLMGFHARRLEAMERVAKDFRGNKQTVKTPFDLPDLAAFEQKARTLAHALQEFVTIERHVDSRGLEAGASGAAGAAGARRADAGRALSGGGSGTGRRREESRERAPQTPQRGPMRRLPRGTPGGNEMLSHEGRASGVGLVAGGDAVPAAPGVHRRRLRPRRGPGADHAQAGRVAGDQSPLDRRQSPAGRGAVRVHPDRQADALRHAGRAGPHHGRRDGERAIEAWAEVVMVGSRGGSGPPGFTFGTINEHPLEAGKIYTLDPNPNDIYGSWAAQVAEGLVAGGRNTLYAVLAGEERPLPLWPEAGAEGQARFMAGLDALHAAGALHGFEPSKREFIGGHGSTPVLLVQGPPGTGKSYSTAFALFARLQGAMAADQDFRAFVSCKTHAATDVLLENVVKVREMLRGFAASQPEIFAAYFDPRLLDVPLFRIRPRGDVPAGVIALPKDDEREAGTPKAIESIEASRWGVVAATPGGTYGLIKERWPKELFGHHLADCLVLDEASQMNLPEAVMAALPLAPDGRLVVVGDHRQMPPIVKHDWASEPRRTFQEFRSYESLFTALLPLEPPMVKFAESFRLHADMAEFLRREVYAQDGINYHSKRHEVLEVRPAGDDFLAAVLAPQHPLVVVVHDEAESQVRNRFEQQLIAPILELLALADPAGYGLDPEEGLGVVVPHRAQRADLQERVPALTRDRSGHRGGDALRGRHRRAVPGGRADGHPGRGDGERPRISARVQPVSARPAAADGGLEPGQAEDGPRRRPLGLRALQRRRGDLRELPALEEPAAADLHRAALEWGPRRRRVEVWGNAP